MAMLTPIHIYRYSLYVMLTECVVIERIDKNKVIFSTLLNEVQDYVYNSIITGNVHIKLF